MSSYSLLFTKVQKDGGLFTIFEQNAKGQDVYSFHQSVEICDLE